MFGDSMKVTGIVCSALLLTSVAFGSPFKGLVMPADNAEVESSESCTEFSGTWKGECTEESEEGTEVTEETITIVQDGCNSLEIDKQTYNLGGSKTTTETSKEDIFTYTIFTDWNENKSEVNAVFNVSGRNLSTDNSFHYTFSGSGDALFKVENQKLVISSGYKGVSKLSDGTEFKPWNKSTCSYEKQ
jgi:hypothetical protein